MAATLKRPRLEVVPPPAYGPASGAKTKRLGRRANHQLLAAPCYCGVGRVATVRYMCTTCARWLRCYREVTARRLAEGPPR